MDELRPTQLKLQTSLSKLDNLQGELVHLANRLHVRSNHWPFPLLAPAIGLIVGLMLYPLLARTLPNGANLTAITTGHRDPWKAGEQLMRDARPEQMNAIVQASHVLRDNAEAFRRCQAQANQTNKAQACTITVAPFADGRFADRVLASGLPGRDRDEERHGPWADLARVSKETAIAYCTLQEHNLPVVSRRRHELLCSNSLVRTLKPVRSPSSSANALSQPLRLLRLECLREDRDDADLVGP